MYNNILYPTDGSSGAEAALAHVRDLAHTYDATVHVLNAVDTTHIGFGMVGHPSEEDSPGMVGHPSEEDSPGMSGSQSDPNGTRSKLEREGERIVTEVADRLADVETVRAVQAGNPHQVILEYAESNDIDIVLMGTHGRSGIDRQLLGSVTEKVIRMSDIPVVVVRLSEDG